MTFIHKKKPHQNRSNVTLYYLFLVYTIFLMESQDKQN